jgi:hypothetical protein
LIVIVKLSPAGAGDTLTLLIVGGDAVLDPVGVFEAVLEPMMPGLAPHAANSTIRTVDNTSASCR